MNFLRIEKNSRIFQLSEQEKRLLMEITRLYPLLPAGDDRLVPGSRPEPQLQESKKLLEQAMADHREQAQKNLREILERRFRPAPPGHQLSLEPGEVECLLQVLNDIRVGSWVSLGCPEDTSAKPVSYAPELAPYAVAMETCAYFEIILLKAMTG